MVLWTFFCVVLHYFPPFIRIFSLIFHLTHIAELQRAAFASFRCDVCAVLYRTFTATCHHTPTHACLFLWHLTHHEFCPCSVMLATNGISVVRDTHFRFLLTSPALTHALQHFAGLSFPLFCLLCTLMLQRVIFAVCYAFKFSFLVFIHVIIKSPAE